MKKSILPFLLLSIGIVVSATSFAQSNYTATDKGKFYVTAGAGALPGYWNEKMPRNGPDRLVVEPSMNFLASLKYFVTPNFALLVGGGYYKVSTKFSHDYYGIPPGSYNAHPNTMVEYTLNTQYDYKTLLAFTECSWVYTRIHRTTAILYGGAGICVTHTTGFTFDGSGGDLGPWGQNIDENKITPNIAALGIRAGRRIGWYAEAGYGFKGILNAGVSVRL